MLNDVLLFLFCRNPLEVAAGWLVVLGIPALIADSRFNEWPFWRRAAQKLFSIGWAIVHPIARSAGELIGSLVACTRRS